MSGIRTESRALPKHSARVAIATLFFSLGCGFGNWVVRIPDVQHELGLDQGALGTALLAASIGALVGMPAVGYLSTRFNGEVLTTLTATAFTLSLSLPALATGLAGLVAALFLLGVGNGALGVMMNTQGSLLEQSFPKPIMASFHGVFSIGGLLGSLGAGWAAGQAISASVHLLLVSVALTVLVLIAAPFLVRGKAARGERVFALPERRVIIFGLLAFCGLLCEGAVSDWSAVLLHDVRNVPPGLAGMGYTAFAAAMAAMRLCGDRVSTGLGPRRTVRLGGAVALSGAVLLVLVPLTWVAVAGFAAVGIGLAIVFPTVISVISGDEAEPALAVSATSTVGYVGFLAGPPLIGYLAQATTLPIAFLVLVGCAAAIVTMGGKLPRTHAARG